MKFAFICENRKIPDFFNRLKTKPFTSYQLADTVKIQALPISIPRCKNTRKKRRLYQQALIMAQKNHCQVLAVKAIDKKHLPRQFLPLADGTYWQISLFKQLLNHQEPRWQQKKLAIKVNNFKESALARYLAQETYYLQLFGEQQELLEQTATAIYRESGLFCYKKLSESAIDLAVDLIIDLTDWQKKLPQAAQVFQNDTLPAHLVEALLFCSWTEKQFKHWYNYRILEKLYFLAKRSSHYKLTPIWHSQTANNSLICSTDVN
ncbi:MAG: hypothetical protein ACOX05_03440 [Bacillota bacterium]|jgi:hypothetical protein